MSAKIAAALHQVMSKVGYVQKTGKNAFHNYRYAGEADLLEKLRPAMVEAGLILLPSVESVTAIDEHGNTTVRVAYTLVHKDGDVWPEKIYAAGTGNDRNKNGVGDKGTYKAITGANKYLLFKLFQIETGDDPEGAEEPAPQAARPVSEPVRQAFKDSVEAEPPYAATVKKMLHEVGEAGDIDALLILTESERWINAHDRLPEAGRRQVDAGVAAKRARLAPNILRAG